MDRISQKLNWLLEKALKTVATDINDMDIVGHFQSQDKEVNLYAVAKDSEYLYGVLDSADEPKTSGGFPLSILESLGLIERFTLPFNCGNYLINGEKIFKPANLNYHFLLDIPFQQRIIKLHVLKSQDYIAKHADDFLLSLGFSKGFKSIPLAIKTTSLVSSHKVSDNNEYLFEQITGFLGLPTYLDIITLMPLLSKYCYQAKNIDDLFSKMHHSNDSQILCFSQTLTKTCDNNVINELVSFVSRQEINPNITEQNINLRQLKKLTISLNTFAYVNIFSKFTTQEMIKSCA